MSEYSLSNYTALSDNKTPTERIQEDLFLSACELYFEEIDPPIDTIKRIREILEPNNITQALIQIKEQNPTLFSYYMYKELDYRISSLINKIHSLSNTPSNINPDLLKEAKNILENLKTKRDTNHIPIQEIEYVDSIFEKISFTK